MADADMGAFDRLREWAINETRILNDGGYAAGDGGSGPDPDDVVTLLGWLASLGDKLAMQDIELRAYRNSGAKAIVDERLEGY